MEPNDITPADLGNGYTLCFQEKPGTDQVRAVVKNAAGEIVVRGNVVSRDMAFTSRFDCLSAPESQLWMPGGFAKADEAADDDLDPDEIDDDDEDEDDALDLEAADEF